MKIRRHLLLALVTGLAVGLSPAQIRLESVAATIGVMRTPHTQSLYSSEFYAWYPEIQIRADVFPPFITATVFWGYWDDGIRDELGARNVITYSARAHILGARVTYHPEFIVPLGIYGGFARHFASTQYVGGHDLEGKPGRNVYQEFNSLEVGPTADISIIERIYLRSELLYMIPLGGESDLGSQKGRWAAKVGLAFRF